MPVENKVLKPRFVPKLKPNEKNRLQEKAESVACGSEEHSFARNSSLLVIDFNATE